MTVYVVVGRAIDRGSGNKITSVNAVFDSEEKANEYCETQNSYWNFIIETSILAPFTEAEWHIEKHILNKGEA